MFILSSIRDEAIMQSVRTEAKEFDDIVQTDIAEKYLLLIHKVDYSNNSTIKTVFRSK